MPEFVKEATVGGAGVPTVAGSVVGGVGTPRAFYRVPVAAEFAMHLDVEAEGAFEACDVARRALKLRPRLIWIDDRVRLSMSAGMVELVKAGGSLSLGGAVSEITDFRLSTYTCEHCGNASLKEDWGPGRVTCPTCGKVASSANQGKGIAT